MMVEVPEADGGRSNVFVYFFVPGTLNMTLSPYGKYVSSTT
jgi:hypothetical protein